MRRDSTSGQRQMAWVQFVRPWGVIRRPGRCVCRRASSRANPEWSRACGTPEQLNPVSRRGWRAGQALIAPRPAGHDLPPKNRSGLERGTPAVPVRWESTCVRPALLSWPVGDGDRCAVVQNRRLERGVGAGSRPRSALLWHGPRRGRSWQGSARALGHDMLPILRFRPDYASKGWLGGS